VGQPGTPQDWNSLFCSAKKPGEKKQSPFGRLKRSRVAEDILLPKGFPGSKQPFLQAKKPGEIRQPSLRAVASGFSFGKSKMAMKVRAAAFKIINKIIKIMKVRKWQLRQKVHRK